MPLKEEKARFKLVYKRILKKNISVNPDKLDEYRQDILEAHNQLVSYVHGKYGTTNTTQDRNVYFSAVTKARQITSDCFKKLNLFYPFTDDIFELLDTNNLQTIDPSDPNPINPNIQNLIGGTSTDSDSDDSQDSNSNQDRQGSNSNQNNSGSDQSTSGNMAITEIEFLNYATKVIPDYDGTPANLQSFIDALTLVGSSVGTEKYVYNSTLHT